MSAFVSRTADFSSGVTCSAGCGARPWSQSAGTGDVGRANTFTVGLSCASPGNAISRTGNRSRLQNLIINGPRITELPRCLLCGRSFDLVSIARDVGGDLDEGQRACELFLRLAVLPGLVQRDRVVVAEIGFAPRKRG